MHKRSLLLALLLLTSSGFAATDVTVENFARAESDTYFRNNMAAAGVELGQLDHQREPVTAENQTVIRQNQDTLYSGATVDLSEPVSITLPDAEGRFMSMHVVNQDHFMFVETDPGTYELTEEYVGTRFAMVIFRTFADARNSEDIRKAHAAQDGIVMKGGGSGPFDAPDWNQEHLAIIRKALSDISALGFDASYAFGRKEETRPVDHLVGAAAGWGGQPRSAAMYVIDSVGANDGQTAHELNVNDVPVDAFWSITVYGEDGRLKRNDLDVNSYNNYTADPNDDGSYTIRFGGCDENPANCIPITPGWSYLARMYNPRAEILDGTWTFPVPVPTP